MKERLKILLVKAFPKLTSVLDLAIKLKALGHQVEIAVPSIDESGKEVIRHDIPVYVVNIRSSLITNNFIDKRFLDLKGVFELRKLYRAAHYDVVHLNLLRARILGRLAHLLGGGAVVVSTIRGADMENPAYHFLEMMTNWVDDGTVSISAATRDYILSKGISLKKLVIIYNGIDLETYDKIPVKKYHLHEQLGLSRQTLLVGMVAYLYPRVKGHEIFLQAARLVLECVPETHFVIVGNDPYGRNYKGSLEKLAKRLKIDHRVHFLSERHDIPNIMDSLKCLVLPSLVEEGFGMVLIEAMAREIPVIGSNIGGIPEVTNNGETGILVKPGDSKELAKAISFILSNPEEVKSMRKAGRKRVEEKFTSDIMAQKYETLFYRLINRKKNE